MPDIVLTTLNARYHHCAFGLRYLMANLGELKSQATMKEFVVGDRTVDIIDALLKLNPRVIGIGVYIWNAEAVTKLIEDLKRVRPDIIVVVGGPEVSYETESQPLFEFVDHVITGEGDIAFRELCEQLLNTANDALPVAPPKIIHAPVPPLDELELPYELYSDNDIQNRVVYVEVSRGCPFTCEFCLSALDIPVRLFDLDKFLAAMQGLLDRGTRQFKFVDRTFNLNIRISRRILEFFLEWMKEHGAGDPLFLHFEMIPDRLPTELREIIALFPPGSLQFEIGVQTFNDDAGELISRRQDNDKLAENMRFLTQETGVHIHADLIIGLPGEPIESFAAGFDRLVKLRPHEIQVGILKRLKGTPITRHDEEWQMVYSASPPFEILSNRLLDFNAMQQLRRFARYWDLVANSGNFNDVLDLWWNQVPSPFQTFAMFSGWLYQSEQRTHGIPLVKLSERLFEFSTLFLQFIPEIVAAKLWKDYVRGGRRDRPNFLKPFDLPPPHELIPAKTSLPPRQARHAGGS